MTFGWFKADASVPNEFSTMTDGWWNTEVGGVVTGALIMLTAVIQHQHMAMGRAA